MVSVIKKASCIVSAGTKSLLTAGWSLAATTPGGVTTPQQLNAESLEWIPGIVPGTAAQALRESGKWDFDRPMDFDASDWWYQCRFNCDDASVGQRRFLCFDGLATLAEIWLNGELILHSGNMFQLHEVDVTRLLHASNDLAICFRSLNQALAERRPRPRWKTKLVSHQQLRWFRTTLLGRIPGWTPPVAPVGPWKFIRLESRYGVSLADFNIQTSLQGVTGIVDFDCTAHTISTGEITATLSAAGQSTRVLAEKTAGGYRMQGQLQVPDAPLWWPHTHGEPVLHDCRLDIAVAGQSLSVDCGKIGFRHIEVNDRDGAFEIQVNGHVVFCRGACWTINDVVSLNSDAQLLTDSLRLARDAGMNMVRVGGTMLYESEVFYSLCDELGILVWQDFMFANMDYPIDDEDFRASVEAEVTQQLKRWQAHPCITVYCGNSEIEQQSAMLGMSKELWRNALFSTLLPDLCRRWHAGVHYIASTPSGGVLPFHTGTGVTHYYGVGAYRRPVTDVRRANVRFASECLGFSNVPEPATTNLVMNGQTPVTHHPKWKARVPRDSGSGYDFEDIRDHYLEQLYGVNAVQLRSTETERYLALSRATSGEIMTQVFSEWRSGYSNCRGGLVWFFKDLWPGAGWGILDSTGLPKACLYYLRRVWQKQTVVLTDEGLDGVHAHVLNETTTPLTGVIEFVLLNAGQVVIAKGEMPFQVEPRSILTVVSDQVLSGFFDASYAYRFGPPKHDVVAVTLRDSKGGVISEAFFFPGLQESRATHGVVVTAEAETGEAGTYRLMLQADRFLHSTYLDVHGFIADNNYFHLMPGRPKIVTFTPTGEQQTKFNGYVEALNLHEPVKITVKE